MLQESVLDYEQLVAQYQHDLFSLLRGHCSLDFLEIWVPDEDHVKSLLNMVEAAQSCGQERIVVQVTPATAHTLDTNHLLELLASLGKPTIESSADGLRLTVANLSGERRMPPAYRRALDARSADLRFLGTLHDESAATIHRITLNGVTLSARVNGDGVVTDAAHDGASGDVRNALDVLCTIMQGRPLQEVADHGVIRLEAFLRDTTVAPPMPGIINALAADDLFVFVEKIARALYATYRKNTGGRATQNTFSDRPQPAWRERSPEERLEAVVHCASATLVQAGWAADDARVLRIEQDDRVMIAFRPSVPPMEKARLALAFEVALHERCDATLQVFLAELKDENAARRL